MTKIKICGLKRLQDIEYVNELKPDFIGFVFAGTKRKIDKETAAVLKKNLNPDILAVGVFVDEPVENIKELVDLHIIDMVQLHGNEDENYLKKLKTVISVPVIKAVRVQSADDIIKAGTMDAQYLLLDSYAKDEMGGTGHGFDKTLIPKGLQNYFLAGGLCAANLPDIIKKYHPFAVDLSSGVETDGVKDREKMKEVIEIVRKKF